MSKDLLIFCVEDDLDIQNLELYTLKANNYDVKGFTNGEELFNELEHAIPSLILLDLMLPLMDGNTILKKLKSKEKFKNIPVIICSAKGSEFNKVALLNEGADDYLVKPFGMMELVARVNAVLRRITKEKQVVLSNGNIKVDLEKHEAYVDNSEIVLTLKEYDLLVYFLSNLNKVISRDELIEKVWGVDFIGESRTIDVHVGTLRSKISSSSSIIQTVRGVGYRMEKLDEKEN